MSPPPNARTHLADDMTRTALWLIPLLALAQSESGSIVRGRWLLTSKGQPANYSCQNRTFGVQPSGLTWAGGRLWGVSDQSSSCPGCLFSLSPRAFEGDTLLLEEDGLPLVHGSEVLAIDAEGIDLLETKEDELTFVVVVEDRTDAIGMAFDDRTPGAALVVRPQWESRTALVSSIWEFKLSEEHAVQPFAGDTNRGFEGIAIDRQSNRGYLAYEQASDGKPRLFTFALPETDGSGSGHISVPIEPVAFAFDFTPAGKPETDLNFNGLALLPTEGGGARLLVLCRNRELLLVLTLTDPKTALLHEQVALRLLSPSGQSIVWVSPEGIAADVENDRLYVVGDPDPSCGGNWKAATGGELHEGRRDAESNLFLQFVPLLFELDAAVVLR